MMKKRCVCACDWGFPQQKHPKHRSNAIHCHAIQFGCYPMSSLCKYHSNLCSFQHQPAQSDLYCWSRFRPANVFAIIKVTYRNVKIIQVTNKIYKHICNMIYPSNAGMVTNQKTQWDVITMTSFSYRACIFSCTASSRKPELVPTRCRPGICLFLKYHIRSGVKISDSFHPLLPPLTS